MNIARPVDIDLIVRMMLNIPCTGVTIFIIKDAKHRIVAECTNMQDAKDIRESLNKEKV